MTKFTRIPMLLGAGTLLFGLCACADEQLANDTATAVATLQTVTVSELKAITDSDSTAWVIDVRSPGEYREVHATPVKQLLVHTEIGQAQDVLPADKDAPVYLICRTGRRSGIAGEALIGMGYTKVFNVLGGTTDWVKEGYPTESGDGILGAP